MCEETSGSRNKHKKNSFYCPQKISMNLQSTSIAEIKK